MGTVVSPHLAAAGAAWDDGPGTGGWIAERLGPFGPSVGHAVPLGYEAYAIVPIPPDGPDENRGSVPVLDALLDVLAPFTGERPVHCAMWDGWAWWYDRGEDPRTAPGMSVAIAWDGDSVELPNQDEIDRELAEALDALAADRVERPDAEPLDLPHRRYHVFTGPLRSITAFGHHPHNPPSLVWPEDRSWVAGAPIYTNELAVAGTSALIGAVLRDARLGARRATPDDVLDIDD